MPAVARPGLHAALLCAALAALPVAAHMMPAQEGTINVVGAGIFVVLALPASAFSGVDENADGLISETELLRHAKAVNEQIEKGFRLYDGKTPATSEYVRASIEPEEKDGAPSVLVLMKQAFAAPPSALRVETSLFGKTAPTRTLRIRVTRGKELDALVLDPAHPQRRLFRPGWLVVWERWRGWLGY